MSGPQIPLGPLNPVANPQQQNFPGHFYAGRPPYPPAPAFLQQQQQAPFPPYNVAGMPFGPLPGPAQAVAAAAAALGQAPPPPAAAPPVGRLRGWVESAREWFNSIFGVIFGGSVAIVALVYGILSFKQAERANIIAERASSISEGANKLTVYQACANNSTLSAVDRLFCEKFVLEHNLESLIRYTSASIRSCPGPTEIYNKITAIICSSALLTDLSTIEVCIGLAVGTVISLGLARRPDLFGTTAPKLRGEDAQARFGSRQMSNYRDPNADDHSKQADHEGADLNRLDLDEHGFSAHQRRADPKLPYIPPQHYPSVLDKEDEA